MQACMHPHIHVHVFMHICCMITDMHIHMHPCMHTYAHTHMHTHMPVCTCTCPRHAYTCKHNHACTHMCTSAPTATHATSPSSLETCEDQVGGGRRNLTSYVVRLTTYRFQLLASYSLLIAAYLPLATCTARKMPDCGVCTRAPTSFTP